MSADQRRAVVVRMAVEEFARGGFQGTSTRSIAARAGVSQPYLFRLFPGKRDVFLAAAEHCTRHAVRAFREAADGLTGAEALRAGERAWRLLVDEDYVFALQGQLHAAAASDEAIRAAAARHWALLRHTVATVTELPGADLEEFFGRMLLRSTVSVLVTGAVRPLLTSLPAPTARENRAAPAPAAGQRRPAAR
ncbi:helix-turn-helix domain containing protein [Streptomyces laculatispora]|uniref:Helix-turn-helix domain containing protein n=1 Tax=Streptomyces laculatispora TaxID=887464 RepID=A0ABY9IDU1_9ACTN|nr:TetR/AcrR family transcriptional regulator [Streptomyces laculatispora]WLQ45098.1 helix-turn-helix domain containing protein [Streptomyces laculatispora]